MTNIEWTHRNRPVRVMVDACASRPPGRRAAWTVQAGQHWWAGSATEKGAADTLAAGLGLFLASYRPPQIVTFRGHTAVVSLDVSNGSELAWHRQTVWPDGHVGSSIGSAESWDAALADARYTLAQASTDWHDDASVQEAAAFLDGGQRFGHGQHSPAELMRYAAWQRAAKAAMDAGRADWHEWATHHQGEFTIQQESEVPQP